MTRLFAIWHKKLVNKNDIRLLTCNNIYLRIKTITAKLTTLSRGFSGPKQGNKIHTSKNPSWWKAD